MRPCGRLADATRPQARLARQLGLMTSKEKEGESRNSALSSSVTRHKGLGAEKPPSMTFSPSKGTIAAPKASGAIVGGGLESNSDTRISVRAATRHTKDPLHPMQVRYPIAHG